MNSYRIDRNTTASLDWIKKGLVENPSQTTYPLFYTYLLLTASLPESKLRTEAEKFSKDFKENFSFKPSLPPEAYRKDALGSWVLFDLSKMHRLAQAHSIPVIFQTYPPLRETGEAWLVDPYIRQVAKMHSAGLSDTYFLLRNFFENEASQPRTTYYDMDDHLNAQGYKLVADNLYREILKTLVF